MSDKKDVDQHSGTQTTGHDWDGIKELDTPLPRWWLGILYASIVWAIGYWIVMPAWPLLGGYSHGWLDHSQRDDVTAQVARLQAARHDKEKELTKADLKQIQSNPDLLQFAQAEGRAAFGDNCVPCHGAGGQGAHGYPNLNDDAWIWGGKLDDIQHTITVGVRSAASDTRNSQMPDFGRSGMLKPGQISDLTEYVVHLSGRPADGGAVRRATQLFADNCAACHGAQGQGNRTYGAPNLTDNEWLYGAAREDIKGQIWNGNGGVMPNWGGRLTPETIKALAVYVHGLGGGE